MITLWHNPRCSKSREALALLEGTGVEIRIRKYLEDAPTRTEIETALTALSLRAIDMMRKGEARFKELGLSPKDDPNRLIDAMAENPILIERPIAFRNGGAVIGRPPENVLDLM